MTWRPVESWSPAFLAWVDKEGFTKQFNEAKMKPCYTLEFQVWAMAEIARSAAFWEVIEDVKSHCGSPEEIYEYVNSLPTPWKLRPKKEVIE